MMDLARYQSIIVDLDGTLYYQRPVRLAMLREMALRFWRISDFLIVKKYRKLFEQCVPEKQRLSQLPDSAPSVIQEWMVKRPCPYIAKHRDEELLDLLANASDMGTLIIVYSDYPVEEKLTALRFIPDLAICSEEIGSLKPEAIGLKKLLLDMAIAPERCLVIGDRQEKDGVLAANLGADALIVPQNPTERSMMYEYDNLRAL